MKVKSFEKPEKQAAELTVSISPEEFENALNEAYKKNKGQINVSGVRKGHAPRKMIENMYGENIFYEDAIEIKTAEQRIAVAEYEHTVLTALGDIRTAYAAYVQEQQRLLQLRQGVLAAQAAYEIASNKYNAGLGDFFDVLDAQRKLFSLDEELPS